MPLQPDGNRPATKVPIRLLRLVCMMLETSKYGAHFRKNSMRSPQPGIVAPIKLTASHMSANGTPIPFRGSCKAVVLHYS